MPQRVSPVPMFQLERGQGSTQNHADSEATCWTPRRHLLVHYLASLQAHAYQTYLRIRDKWGRSQMIWRVTGSVLPPIIGTLGVWAPGRFGAHSRWEMRRPARVDNNSRRGCHGAILYLPTRTVRGARRVGPVDGWKNVGLWVRKLRPAWCRRPHRPGDDEKCRG